MPTQLDLTQRIEGLLERRHHHAAAIASIDETLSRVEGVLARNGAFIKLPPLKDFA